MEEIFAVRDIQANAAPNPNRNWRALKVFLEISPRPD
jgi:hypothetical protein